MPVAMACTPLLLVLALSLQDKGSPSDPAEALRPFWKPVTLSAKETSALELLQEVFKQSGEPLEKPRQWEPKSISIDLKGVPFWQAVDEICRRDGAVGFHPSRHWTKLQAGASVPPTAYAGPVRFAITDVSRVREIRYPERKDRTELSVQARWMQAYAPIQDPWPFPGTLEVVRAVDRQGRSLLPLVTLEETFTRTGSAGSLRSAEWLIRLQPADRTERVLPVVEMRWNVLHAEEIGDVVFEHPIRAEGASRQVGEIKVTLDRCARDARGGSMLETLITLEVDPTTLTPEARRAIEAIPLQRRLLHETEIDGNRGGNFFADSGDKTNPFKVTMKHWMKGEPAPQSVKFKVARRIRSLSIPLTFTDVPLPETGK